MITPKQADEIHIAAIVEKIQWARRIALGVGMSEYQPGVFIAPHRLVAKDTALAAAVLAGLAPCAPLADLTRGTLVFCFPGLPPR